MLDLGKIRSLLDKVLVYPGSRKREIKISFRREHVDAQEQACKREGETHDRQVPMIGLIERSPAEKRRDDGGRGQESSCSSAELVQDGFLLGKRP